MALRMTALDERTEILHCYFSGLSSSFSLPAWQQFFVHVGFLSKGKRINCRNSPIAKINIIHRINPILSSIQTGMINTGAGA
jgi:hypothetical protein